MNRNLSKPEVIVFGSGAVGKGLIGLLLSQASYHVTFIDIKDDLVKILGDAGSYDVLIHRLNDTEQQCSVEGFDVIHALERQATAKNS